MLLFLRIVFRRSVVASVQSMPSTRTICRVSIAVCMIVSASRLEYSQVKLSKLPYEATTRSVRYWILLNVRLLIVAGRCASAILPFVANRTEVSAVPSAYRVTRFSHAERFTDPVRFGQFRISSVSNRVLLPMLSVVRNWFV